MACCEKYKALILKYVPCISKYMPYIFRFSRPLKHNDLQRVDFLPWKRLFSGLEKSYFSCRVNAEEYEQENGESPERRTSIAEKRQGDAYDGSESYDHAHVYEHVKQEYAQHTIAENAPESKALAFGKGYEAQNETQIDG